MRDSDAPVLSFDVDGLPPIAAEGLSVLTAGHRQAERVRSLLAAARTAARADGWSAVSGPVGLEVVLRVPPGHRTTDAASLLGGVAAVLQDRKRAGQIGLAALGALADTALYVDERQIRRLSFRELAAVEFSYHVRVTALPELV